MEGSVLAYLAGVDFNDAEPFICTLKNAFIEGDVPGFVGAIQTFFAQVPHKLRCDLYKEPLFRNTYSILCDDAKCT